MQPPRATKVPLQPASAAPVPQYRLDTPAVQGSGLRRVALAALLAPAIVVSLYLTLAQMAAARDPSEQNAVRRTPQDKTDDEKAQRDAAGLLTIEGTVVDENGNPVSNARIRLHTSLDRAPAALSDSRGRFRFLSVDLPTTRYLLFVAENLKDGTKGYLAIAAEGTLGPPAPVKIMLKPPRELAVAVNDSGGRPVAGALVEFAGGLDEGRTGPDGTLRFRLPADADIGLVVALKSGVGFDYWTDRVGRRGELLPLPPKLTFTLNGACTVRVRAIDSAGQPVVGVGVVPWLISKQARGTEANVNSFQLQRTKANSDGIATFDWLPIDAEPVTFLTTSDDYHLPTPPSLQPDPNGKVADITMQLLRATRISGTVRTADGNPAAGIVVQAEGRGGTNHYFRGFARTDADGEFEFRAYPGQSYLVSVLDENWAAPSCTVAELREDEPVGDLELRLDRGTVLRGTASDVDGSPRVDATLTLVQTAELPAPATSPELVRWARTDRQGHYRFRVGPGTYLLKDPDHKRQVPLTIEAQREEVHNFRAER